MKLKVGDIWIEPWNGEGFPVYILTGIERNAVSLAPLGTPKTPPTQEDIVALGNTPKGEPKRYRRMSYAGIPHASFIEGGKHVRTIVPWEMWRKNQQKDKAGD